MVEEQPDEKVLLPHHEQQTLCTTRLPYRQGRKLTAVKVYTVNAESNHLLVFGVPSIKLRQEAKSLFAKFGKLQQFTITTKYPIEPFTENYHAVFERIQSARIAKKMLDTKNFYGGSLHVCYAPELEQIEETRNKILQRQKDVMFRLKNLQKEKEMDKKKAQKQKSDMFEDNSVEKVKKLNMSEENVIVGVDKQIRDVVFNKNKRKLPQQQNVVIEKQFKPCFVDNKVINTVKTNNQPCNNVEIEIIDCTSAETETITNINETLNYNKFGNEIIKKIPQKPINKIKFNIGSKT